jgi:hypothetical protein
MIANIASYDVRILPHRANPAGLNFRERQGFRSAVLGGGFRGPAFPQWSRRRPQLRVPAGICTARPSVCVRSFPSIP